MATRKIYDAAVAVREYTTRDGQQKKQWQNVGAVLQFDDGGMCMILEKWFNPAGIAGDGGVRISFFEPKPREGLSDAPPVPAQRQTPRPVVDQPADYDDQIPF